MIAKEVCKATRKENVLGRQTPLEHEFGVYWLLNLS